MTLENVLQVVRKDLQDVGGNLQPGASDASIDVLRNRTQRELGYPLPTSYELLLKITDGLSCGGVAIYGTSSSSLVGSTDSLISGFIKSNGDFRSASPLFDEYLVFGSDGDALMTYNKAIYEFALVTVFLVKMRSFSAFEEMVCDVLNKAM